MVKKFSFCSSVPLSLVLLSIIHARAASPSPKPLIELKSSILGSIQLEAPPATWDSPQLSVTQSSETTQDFNTTFTGDRKTQKRLPGEVRIQSGKSRPRATITVRWILPVQANPGKNPPLVMAQFLYDSETESHDYFTEIPSTYNPDSRELKAQVAPKYFTDERGDSGLFEAILVVVTNEKK